MKNSSKRVERGGRALKVCLFSHLAGLGGAERMLLELVGDLRASFGVHCLVVVPGRGPLVGALREAGAGVVVCNFAWWCAREAVSPSVAHASLHASLGELDRLMPEVAAFDPDVVWTQTLVLPWGAVLAGLIGKPHVWYVTELGELDHGLQFFAPFSEVASDILECSDQVFTCSRFIRDTIFSDAARSRVDILYTAIPTPQPGAGVGLFQRPGALKLGFFSTLHPSKGPEDVIRAASLLAGRGIEIELALLGDGDSDYAHSLQRLAQGVGLANAVTFAGFIADPYPTMATADIIVVCSRAEAFGRVGVEAMLLGKPVVYPNTGGLLEYMLDGQTGYAYPPGEPELLAERLLRLLGERGRWGEMGRIGREHALRLFSSAEFAGKAFRTMNRLRREGRRARRIPACAARLIGSASGVRRSGPIERNAPCPCGSGKRYKHCHERTGR